MARRRYQADGRVGEALSGTAQDADRIQALRMIHFVGKSHAAVHLRDAAIYNGVLVTEDIVKADLIFVSEDTPTDSTGMRDLWPIRLLVEQALHESKAPVVLTSQVTPGFSRSFNEPRLIHIAETLRILDAEERARRPEQFIIGMSAADDLIPEPLHRYCSAHDADMNQMTYEEAEFAKIAINMFLAAQVDCTNKLAAAAHKVGARWAPIASVLKNDKRIGPHAY